MSCPCKKKNNPGVRNLQTDPLFYYSYRLICVCNTTFSRRWRLGNRPMVTSAAGGIATRISIRLTSDGHSNNRLCPVPLLLLMWRMEETSLWIRWWILTGSWTGVARWKTGSCHSTRCGRCSWRGKSRVTRKRATSMARFVPLHMAYVWRGIMRERPGVVVSRCARASYCTRFSGSMQNAR